MQIPLRGSKSSNKMAIVSPEDYGMLMRYSWYYRDGYAITKIKGKEFRMHRLVMQVSDPDDIVDHVNRNRLDNRRENLRVLTYLENANNRSDNHFLACFGEAKTIAEWSRDERCCVSYETLRARLRRGVEAWAAILAPEGAGGYVTNATEDDSAVVAE